MSVGILLQKKLLTEDPFSLLKLSIEFISLIENGNTQEPCPLSLLTQTHLFVYGYVWPSFFFYHY